jgi:hypothetical protein
MGETRIQIGWFFRFAAVARGTIKYGQRSRALELIQRGGEDGVAVRAGAHGRQQRALSLPRDVVEGRQRPGCKKRIAGPPEHSRVALLLREFLQQHGFADAASPRTSAIQPPRSGTASNHAVKSARYRSRSSSSIGRVPAASLGGLCNPDNAAAQNPRSAALRHPRGQLPWGSRRLRQISHIRATEHC